MAIYEVDIRGKRYQVDAASESELSQAVQKLAQEPQHFELGEAPGQQPQVSQPSAYGLGAADIGGMGFADELGSYVGSALTGEDREQVLKEMRARNEAAREQHPKSYVTGQVGGGVAQAVAGGVPAILRGGSSLLAKTLTGMLMGGTSGAVHGAGSGEDANSRMINALIEGATGATVGAALPAVGAGAGRLFAAGRDALARRGIMSLPVARQLQSAIPDAAEAAANIQAAGPNAMLADAGPNAQAILDAAIQRGGKGGDIARKAVETRTKQAAGSIDDALDIALGKPEGVETARKAIAQGSAAARGSAYDAAYASPIDYASPTGMEIEQIVKTRVPKSAIDAANELMRTEGAKSKQILANVDADGNVTFKTMPDVRQLDYIKRGLNAVAEEADAKGKMGGTTARGRAYANLARELRDKVKDAVPEYGTALETAADPLSRSSAVKFGSKLLSKATTREEVADFVDGISKPERQALLQGIRSQIDDARAAVTRTLTDPNVDAREAMATLRELSSRSNKAKLRAALGDDAAADALFDQLEQDAKAFELRAATARNSATAARQGIERDVKAGAQPNMLQRVGRGEPVVSAKKMIQAITGMTDEHFQNVEEGRWAELADILTRPQAAQMLHALQKNTKYDAATRLMQDRIMQGVIGGVGPTTQQTAPMLKRRLGIQ